MNRYYIKIGKLYLENIDFDKYCGITNFIYEMKLCADPDCCFSYDNQEEAANIGYLLEDILGREITVEERK